MQAIIPRGKGVAWQIIVLMIAGIVLFALMIPRVLTALEEVQSQEAIETAEALFEALERFDALHPYPLIEVGETQVYERGDLAGFLNRQTPEGARLFDYVDEDWLEPVTRIVLYRSNPELSYQVRIHFWQAVGQYRRVELTPEGIDWDVD